MKKRLCIFLICWLPCFVMAANVMAMQMFVAQSLPAAQQTEVHAQADSQAMSEMPCHQHEQAHEQMADKTTPAKTHHCDVCGFCAVASGVSHFHAFPDLPLIASASAAPLFFAAPVHSQSYPPAFKPPIFS
jgi:hypothetical protein